MGYPPVENLMAVLAACEDEALLESVQVSEGIHFADQRAGTAHRDWPGKSGSG